MPKMKKKKLCMCICIFLFLSPKLKKTPDYLRKQIALKTLKVFCVMPEMTLCYLRHSELKEKGKEYGESVRRREMMKRINNHDI